ncbi:unnamed protein product [Symbiodinium microadriaticum]|nr:unnamed protein product [Symbiodinium microadriaticum]
MVERIIRDGRKDKEAKRQRALSHAAKEKEIRARYQVIGEARQPQRSDPQPAKGRDVKSQSVVPKTEGPGFIRNVSIFLSPFQMVLIVGYTYHDGDRKQTELGPASKPAGDDAQAMLAEDVVEVEEDYVEFQMMAGPLNRGEGRMSCLALENLFEVEQFYINMEWDVSAKQLYKGKPVQQLFKFIRHLRESLPPPARKLKGCCKIQADRKEAGKEEEECQEGQEGEEEEEGQEGQEGEEEEEGQEEQEGEEEVEVVDDPIIPLEKEGLKSVMKKDRKFGLGSGAEPVKRLKQKTPEESEDVLLVSSSKSAECKELEAIRAKIRELQLLTPVETQPVDIMLADKGSEAGTPPPPKNAKAKTKSGKVVVTAEAQISIGVSTVHEILLIMLAIVSNMPLDFTQEYEAVEFTNGLMLVVLLKLKPGSIVHGRSIRGNAMADRILSNSRAVLIFHRSLQARLAKKQRPYTKAVSAAYARMFITGTFQKWWRPGRWFASGDRPLMGMSLEARELLKNLEKLHDMEQVTPPPHEQQLPEDEQDDQPCKKVRRRKSKAKAKAKASAGAKDDGHKKLPPRSPPLTGGATSGVVRDVGEDAQPSFPSDELPTPFKSTQKETPLKDPTPSEPKPTPGKASTPKPKPSSRASSPKPKPSPSRASSPKPKPSPRASSPSTRLSGSKPQPSPTEPSPSRAKPSPEAATAPAKPKQTPRKSLLETFESVSDVPPETTVLTIPAAQPDLSSESGDEILRYAMHKNLVELSSGEEEKDDYVGTPLKDTKAEPDLSADDTQDDASSDENEAGGKTLAKLTKPEEAKLEAVLRRLCKADRRGNYQEAFLQKVNHVYRQSRSNEFKTKSGFYTDQMMADELKFSEKDKYQKKLLWYWCDIAYEGTKASKDEEELIRDTSLCDGARVSEVPLGLESKLPDSDEEVDNDADDDDDDNDDEDDEEGDEMKQGKLGKRRSKENLDGELEDIDGVPTMLDEMLKLDQRASKLVDRKVANLQTRIAELSQKHDELADMKSAYDCDETIDTVKLSKLINTVNKMYFVDKISGQQHLEGHPCIMFSDFLATLADMDKMEILTAGADLRSFWDKMQPLKPHHPVYKLSAEDRAFTIPIYLIGDEGRGYKKSAVFVLGSEPVLGSGCEAEDERTAAEPLRMNFRGNSIVTRQLYSVMPRTTYLKDSTPLHKLVSAWAEDLAKCFTTGLEVTLWDFGVTGAAATGIDKNLSHLYDEMKVFEKKNKLYLHMNALTKGLLAISSSADFPYGAWFKGADTTFVMKFLIFKFQNVLEEHDFQDSEVRLYFEQILACLKAFDSFLSMLYKAGLFFELPRLAKIFRCGRTMVQLYAKIATLAYGRHLPRFKLNPKYHMLLHVLLDLKFATESNCQALNPISHSCQMAEDFINRIATLGRSVKANKVPERTLYLYKVELARVTRSLTDVPAQRQETVVCPGSVGEAVKEPLGFDPEAALNTILAAVSRPKERKRYVGLLVAKYFYWFTNLSNFMLGLQLSAAALGLGCARLRRAAQRAAGAPTAKEAQQARVRDGRLLGSFASTLTAHLQALSVKTFAEKFRAGRDVKLSHSDVIACLAAYAGSASRKREDHADRMTVMNMKSVSTSLPDDGFMVAARDYLKQPSPTPRDAQADRG